MSRFQRLRLFVSQRLNAAVEEILEAFEKTVAKYEQEAALSQEVISRQHALLCALNKPLMDGPSADTSQQLFVSNKGVSPHDQEEPRDQEEPQDLDETEIIQFTYNARCGVARAGSAEPAAAGSPQDVQLVSSETEDSEDYSRPPPKAQRVRPPGRLSCKVCRRVFRARRFLIRHVRAHLQEEEPPTVCGLCGKRFEAAEALKLHFLSHLPGNRSAERRRHRHPVAAAAAAADTKPRPGLTEHTCGDCGKTFSQAGPKKKHRCRLRRKR